MLVETQKQISPTIIDDIVFCILYYLHYHSVLFDMVPLKRSIIGATVGFLFFAIPSLK